MSKKKKKKNIDSTIQFMNLLENALRKTNKGTVDADSCSDNSCTWINLQKNDKTLQFLFNADGKLEDINLFVDVMQVVDQKRIF